MEPWHDQWCGGGDIPVGPPSPWPGDRLHVGRGVLEVIRRSSDNDLMSFYPEDGTVTSWGDTSPGWRGWASWPASSSPSMVRTSWRGATCRGWPRCTGAISRENMGHSCVLCRRNCTERELNLALPEGRFKFGKYIQTMQIDMDLYLQYLTDKFKSNGKIHPQTTLRN